MNLLLAHLLTHLVTYWCYLLHSCSFAQLLLPPLTSFLSPIRRHQPVRAGVRGRGRGHRLHLREGHGRNPLPHGPGAGRPLRQRPLPGGASSLFLFRLRRISCSQLLLEFVFVDFYYHYCYFISSFIVIAFITVVLRRNIRSGRGDE